MDLLELQPFRMGAGAAVCCRDPVSPAEETMSAAPAALPGIRTGHGGGTGPAAEPSFRVAALPLGRADRHLCGIYLPLVGGDLFGSVLLGLHRGFWKFPWSGVFAIFPGVGTAAVPGCLSGDAAGGGAGGPCSHRCDVVAAVGLYRRRGVLPPFFGGDP